MSVQLQETSDTLATPTFYRKLSSNELSYFLQSRADGANDLFILVEVQAPEALLTPLRIQIVWAILRLRHTLLASRVQMKPGCYDDARFVYASPASPQDALLEAAQSVQTYNDVPLAKLADDFLNGPRKLSSEILSRLDIVRQRRGSEGVYMFTLFMTVHHMINDARGIYEVMDVALELLAGFGGPDRSRTRTDEELLGVLNEEWMKRWGSPMHSWHVIPAATEDRLLPLPRSKLQQACDRVEYENIQSRYIGAHSFNRIDNPSSKKSKTRFIRIRFDVAQTKAILAKCKSERVSPANAIFGLINITWIRLAARHPSLVSSIPNFPMLMYTAISLREHLPPATELSSHLSLALGYHNVVLPAFAPTERSLREVFWARSREAQRQMRAFTRSPLLLSRSLVACEERGRRAKMWARIDDEAAGLLPPSPSPAPSPEPAKQKSIPSIALMGVSQSGDTSKIYRTHLYPSLKIVDTIGGPRRGKGAGMFVYTRTTLEQFGILLLWDEGAYAQGLAEQFVEMVVDGMREYVLEDGSGGVEVTDLCASGKNSRAKL
ncbi:hypothetical protein C8F01DRAFT_1255978 [Mycena amicta]|nr:hypothetical protein C8F01DRAFT_1255978 [Mycena amicta]